MHLDGGHKPHNKLIFSLANYIILANKTSSSTK